MSQVDDDLACRTCSCGLVSKTPAAARTHFDEHRRRALSEVGRLAEHLDSASGEILVVHPSISGSARNPRDILAVLRKVIAAHPGETPVTASWIVSADHSHGAGIVREASIAGSVASGPQFTRALGAVGEEIVVGDHRAPLTARLPEPDMSEQDVAQLRDKSARDGQFLSELYDLTEMHRGDRTDTPREDEASAVFSGAVEALLPRTVAETKLGRRPRDCVKLRAAIARAVVAMCESVTATGMTEEDLVQFLEYEDVKITTTSGIREAMRRCGLVWQGELPTTAPSRLWGKQAREM